MTRRFSVVVHGGAWAIPQALTAASVAGVERAVRTAHAALASGVSAVDAVEAAVRVMEDDPAFDAGVGSCLNADGEVEMDAIIMADGDGGGLRMGAVAAIQHVANPVSVARHVMDHTPHCLLVGNGATCFALNERCFPRVETANLVTDHAQREFQELSRFGTAVDELYNLRSRAQFRGDTVGAVAWVLDGDMACATSTGGITHKRPGRVGDSPLPGCGAYVDATIGAISTTGHGESIMKVALARHCLDLMRWAGHSGPHAAHIALEDMSSRTLGGRGGLVGIDHRGIPFHAFTSERMAWAAITMDGSLLSGIDP
uniref:Asparaginase n=1 Tax=Compsopogon caeruleus TaxID=31354 RepID=A0A7S1XFM1_9RHOD|mmetsp:Transcript_4003/g.7713  ORF Transcript_4003/g.7713 Transcript_4003/m.7713 type:complete len:314 (+) Transcript_4003:43-984(+)